MRILGIDFGIKKIGLAISDGELAEPYQQSAISNQQSAIKKLRRICQEERIGKIVVGVSEGRMAEQTYQFGYQLRKATGLPVEYQDETLSSEEAKELMVKIGKPKKKRQQQIDSISAAIILQNYLDHQNKS